MLAAAVDLLVETPPEQITIRDVADASGHHHRFVKTWFGGKVGLFRAAFDRLGAEVGEAISSDLSGTALGPRSLALARLMNWLIATDPAAFDGPRPTPVNDRVTATYVEQLGLDEDEARLVAARTIGTAVSFLLFRSALGVDEQDMVRLAALDREMVALLADARRRQG